MRDSRTLSILILMAAWMAATAQQGAAQGPLAVEAAVGRPFGVGRIDVQVPESLQPQPLGLTGLGVSAREGRVLYPVINAPMIGQLVRGILEQADRPAARLLGGLINPPPKATIYFLFQGDAPLELTLRSQRVSTFRVLPQTDPALWSRLMAAWWRTYTATPGLLQSQVDYPPMVENYLQAMLARRLDLPLHKNRPKVFCPPRWNVRWAQRSTLSPRFPRCDWTGCSAGPPSPRKPTSPFPP